MRKHILVLLVVAGLSALAVGAAVAYARHRARAGERIVGGGATTAEPSYEAVYDDMTGAIRYVSTPRDTPDPVRSNPIAAAPFYLRSTGSARPSPKLHAQLPRCAGRELSDHGQAVAGAAQAIMPSVYSGGVIGHDHLMAGPGSHGDFNVAWVPTLVLFHEARRRRTGASRHRGSGGGRGRQPPGDRGPARRHEWDTESDLPLLGRLGRRVRRRRPVPRLRSNRRSAPGVSE